MRWQTQALAPRRCLPLFFLIVAARHRARAGARHVDGATHHVGADLDDGCADRDGGIGYGDHRAAAHRCRSQHADDRRDDERDDHGRAGDRGRLVTADAEDARPDHHAQAEYNQVATTEQARQTVPCVLDSSERRLNRQAPAYGLSVR